MPEQIPQWLQPMNRRRARRQARQTVRLEYGPTQRFLDQRLANTGGYFDDYRQQVDQIQQQGNQRLGGLVGDVSASNQRQLQAFQPTAQAYGADPSIAVQQQQGAAQQYGAQEEFTNLLRGLMAGQSNYLDNRKVVGETTRLRERLDTTDAQEQLQGAKGARMGELMGQFRETERRNLLERAAFGLDEAQASEGAMNTRAQFIAEYGLPPEDLLDGVSRKERKVLRRMQNTGSQPAAHDHYGVEHEQYHKLSPGQKRQAKARWDDAGESKDTGSLATPEQTRQGRIDLRNGIHTVRKNMNASPSYFDGVFEQMVAAGYDPAIARAAIQLVRHDKVGPKTREALLRDYGITPDMLPKGVRKKQPEPSRVSPGPQNVGATL